MLQVLAFLKGLLCFTAKTVICISLLGPKGCRIPPATRVDKFWKPQTSHTQVELKDQDKAALARGHEVTAQNSCGTQKVQGPPQAESGHKHLQVQVPLLRGSQTQHWPRWIGGSGVSKSPKQGPVGCRAVSCMATATAHECCPAGRR